jgi:hypothetical protein
MKRLALIVLCVATAYGQEKPVVQVAPELKGVRVGMTMEKFLKTEAGKDTGQPHDAGTMGLIIVAESSVGGVPARMTYAFDKSTSAIYNIQAVFHASSAVPVAQGLSEKYGKLTSKGATAMWILGKYQITLVVTADDQARLDMTDTEIALRISDRVRKEKSRDL